MPTYKDPRHGVSVSEAQHEAAYVAPVGRTMLTTLELYHPIGTVDPIYVVADAESFEGTKEADAERDPGATVEFLAASLEVQRPEESDGAPAPSISIKVGNVSGVMSDALRRARGSLEPWQLVERTYASDDSSGPAFLPPMRLLVSNVDIDAQSVAIGAGYGDVGNVMVPRITFKRSEYALVR